MMLKNLNLFFICLFFLLQHSASLNAQNINGFTIYVSKNSTTTLFFHDDVEKINFGEKNCPYTRNSLMSDEKSIVLVVSNEVKDQYTLNVTEGIRRHKFIILYKEEIEFSDRNKDYSSLNQLKKLIEDFNKSGEQTIKNNIPNNTQNNTITENKIDKSAPSIVKSDTDDNYAALIIHGDQLKKSGQLEQAKNKYEKALQIQPDNKYAQAGLQEVKNLLEQHEATKYADITTKANNAFIANKLDEALQYYKEALRMKPDDIIINNQILVIQKKSDAAKLEAANMQKDSLFNSYINAGDRALNDKLYNTAKIAYGEALKIKQNDAFAIAKQKTVDQRAAADSIAAEQQKNEALYNSYLKAGDKALEEKLYETAKMAYGEALKLKSNNGVAKARLNAVDQKITADSREEERKKNESLYAAYISLADKALNVQSYDVAKAGYDSASKIKLGDTYAKGQAKKIQDILRELQKQAQKNLEFQKDQVRQSEYASVISLADQEYNSGMYAEAKEQYNKALELNKNDAYSKSKIIQINKIISEINTKEITDRAKRRLDSLNDIKYIEVITKADKAFKNKDYSNAKLSYTAALKYKDDPYSKDRLAEIAAKKQAEKDSVFKETDTEKKYAALLINAKAAYNKKDYTTARIAYAAAQELRPKEEEPKIKLAEIDKELAEIERIKTTQNMYDSLTSIADISLANQQFAIALLNYTSALNFNPPEQSSYLQKQIKYIQSQIAKQDSINNNQTQEAEEEKKEDLYDNYIKAGDNALNEKLFVLATSNFNSALKIKQNDAYATGQIKKIENLLAAAENQARKDSIVITKSNEKIEVSERADNNRDDIKAANEIESEMIFVRSNLFKMGNNVGANDESPLHVVKIDSFYIGKYEVTQTQWKRIMGNNPSEFKNCDNCPAENISWNDAMKFIQKLNSITNKNYRLPTEAEWEFVAGAQSRKERIEDIAWYNDDSKNKTHPVGQLKPNFLGIYDMYGNVEEWCSDWYDFRAYSRNSVNNPKGPESGKDKVLRGGSWYDMEGAFRVQVREKLAPAKSNKKTGIRLALSVN